MPAPVLLESILGIDTHKLTHVAAIVDGLGRMQGTFAFAATDSGAAVLLAWASAHGSPRTAGVEGTGSYGYQLTRALQVAGITVLEVNRPDRANRRRRGKSDPVDAEAAARAVLSGQATAIPKNREGAIESLRALTIARNSAVKATTTASNQIKAILVGADQELRDAMKVQSLLELATRTSNLAPLNGQRLALASLGRRWLQLHAEILELDTMIRTSPVQASSGQTHRHRLSRGGDRAANNALWTIATNRMIHDARTREFATRRKTDGDSRNDTLRVLKHYIARETFALIRDALRYETALSTAA